MGAGGGDARDGARGAVGMQRDQRGDDFVGKLRFRRQVFTEDRPELLKFSPKKE